MSGYLIRLYGGDICLNAFMQIATLHESAKVQSDAVQQWQNRCADLEGQLQTELTKVQELEAKLAKQEDALRAQLADREAKLAESEAKLAAATKQIEVCGSCDSRL